MDKTTRTIGPAKPDLTATASNSCECSTAAAPEDPWKKGFTRRRVMQGSAAFVAALGLQTVTSRMAFAADPSENTDTVVVINLRGGWDSLSMIVPTFESAYYAARPNIAIPKAAALPMARGFGLHPGFKELHRLYQAKQFAPIVGVGTPDDTMSHFDAMDTLERGTATGDNNSGWINRAIKLKGAKDVFNGVQFGPQLPLALTGEIQTVALDRVESFGLVGYDDRSDEAATALTRLYSPVQHPMTAAVNQTLGAINRISNLRAAKYSPAGGAVYPDGGFSEALKDTSQLIKNKFGLRFASIDIGGWDMHTGAGRVDGGDMLQHVTELDAGLSAFIKDLGPEFNNVTVVLVSEFGRTLRENGTGGTDHGHGQTMMVLGGALNGGQVYGTWPGLAEGNLARNGAVSGTLDYRDVLGDVLANRSAITSFTTIFPDHKPKPVGLTKKR